MDDEVRTAVPYISLGQSHYYWLFFLSLSFLQPCHPHPMSLSFVLLWVTVSHPCLPLPRNSGSRVSNRKYLDFKTNLQTHLLTLGGICVTVYSLQLICRDCWWLWGHARFQNMSSHLSDCLKQTLWCSKGKPIHSTRLNSFLSTAVTTQEAALRIALLRSDTHNPQSHH